MGRQIYIESGISITLNELLSEFPGSVFEDEVNEVKIENEKLREALEAFLDMSECMDPACDKKECPWELAHEALAECAQKEGE